MILEVYLTIALVALVVLGIPAYFLVPPMLRRIKAENLLEEQQRHEKAREAELRAAAERELKECLQAYEQPENKDQAQENKTS